MSTQKIEMSTAKNNRAIEIDKGEKNTVGRIEVTFGFVDHFT